MERCSNCGAEIGVAANFCSNCGAAQAEPVQAEAVEPVGAPPDGGGGLPAESPPAADLNRPAAPRNIENHLIKSVIATVCCCVPVGIVGIIYAAKVDTLLRQGNRAAAEEAGKKAGMWSSLAIGIGLVTNVLAALLTIIFPLKEWLSY